MGSKLILYIIAYALGIFALLYFFVILPGNKKNKKQRQMHEALQAGDKIHTIGGIVGTITERDGDTVKVLIDEKNGTTITIVIYAVQQVIRSAKQSEVPSPSSPEA